MRKELLTLAVRMQTAAADSKALKDIQGRMNSLNESIANNTVENRKNKESWAFVSKEYHAAQERIKQYRLQLVQLQNAGRRAMGSLEDATKKVRLETDKATVALAKEGEAIRKNMGQAKAYVETSRDVNRELGKTRSEVNKNRSAWGSLATAWTKTRKALHEVGEETDVSIRKLSRMGTAMRGLSIVSVIGFLQAFVTALVAAGGQAVALAGSLVQVAGVIGGSLIPAITQAIPVLGIFAAVLQRINLLQNAYTAQQAVDKAAGREAATNLNQQADATRAIEDAQRNLAQAQNDLTDARRDAKRELQDLMAAEEEATLSHLQAREALRQTIASGDVSGIAAAQIAVRSTRTDKNRASSDLGRAQLGGIESIDSYESALERVEDAELALADARRNSTEQIDAQSASVGNLDYALGKLTETEQQFLNQFMDFKDQFEKTFNPITDIIFKAFSKGLDQVSDLLFDPKIVTGFTKLTREIADQLGKVFKFFTNKRTMGFWEDILKQARKNLGPVTDIFLNLSKLWMRIARVAGPTFTRLLRLINRELGDLLDGLKPKEIESFFDTGFRHLKAWGALLGNIVELFGALMGVSGNSALDTLDRFTAKIQEGTDWIHNNAREARQYFKETADALAYIGDIILAVAGAFLEAFDPKTLEDFRNIIDRFVVPAIEQFVETMGWLVGKFEDLTSNDVGGWLTRTLFMVAAVGGAFKVAGGFIGFFLRPLNTLIATMTGKTIFDWIKRFGSLIRLNFAGTALATKIEAGASAAATALKKPFMAAGTAIRDFLIKMIAGSAAGEAGATTLLGAIKSRGPAIRTFFRSFGRKFIGLALITGIIFAFLHLDDIWDIMKYKVAPEFYAMGLHLGQAIGEAIIDTLNDILRIVPDKVLELMGLDPNTPIGMPTQLTDEWVDSQVQAFKDRARGLEADDEDAEATQKWRDKGVSTHIVTDDELAPRGLISEGTIEQDAAGKARVVEEAVRKLNRTFKQGKEEQKGFRDEAHEVIKKQGEQVDSVGKLKKELGKLSGSMGGVAQLSRKMGKMIGDVTNSILKEFGAKELAFALPAISSAATGTAAVAGVLDLAGAQTGGWMGNPWERTPDDRLIAVAGGEAVLTGHQQKPVDMALAYGKSAGVVPYGSLDEIFNRDKREHRTAGYQRGGKKKPGPEVNSVSDVRRATSNPWEGQEGTTGYGMVLPASQMAPVGPNVYRPGTTAIAHPNLVGDMQSLQQQYQLAFGDIWAPEGTHSSGSDHYWGGGADIYPAAGNWDLVDQLAAWAEPGGVPRWPFRWVGYDGDANHGRGNHLHLSWLFGAAMGNAVARAMGSSGAFGGGVAAQAVEQIKKIKIKGPKGILKDMLQGQADKLRKAANKKIMKEAGGSGGAGTAYSGPLDRSFPEGSSTQIAPWQAAQLAEAVGLPGITFAQIAKGESDFAPGAVGYDPGGTQGLGLWQITTGFNDHIIAQLGGRNAMFNPVINARAAKMIYDERIAMGTAGTSAWYGDSYMTGTNLHWDGQRDLGLQRGGRIPGFNDGGVVPGPRGSPQLVMAHGGETFIPTHQTGGKVQSPTQETFNSIYSTVLEFPNSAGKLEEFQKVIVKLLGDGGLFDQLTEEIAAMTETLAAQVVKWTYKLRGGQVSQIRTSLEIARKTLDNLVTETEQLQKRREYLQDVEDETVKNMKDAEKALKRAKEEGKEKDIKSAQEQIEKLETALNDIDKTQEEYGLAIAANLQARFEAQQALMQARIDQFSNRSSSFGSRIGLLQLQDQLTGNVSVSDQSMLLAQNQINLSGKKDFLQKRLKNAQRTGNAATAKQLREELIGTKSEIIQGRLDLRELVASAWDKIIGTFDEALSDIDVSSKIESLTNTVNGIVDTKGIQQTFGQRQNFLSQKAVQLKEAIASAKALGDTERVTELENELQNNQVSLLESITNLWSDMAQAFDEIRSRIADKLTKLDLGKRIQELKNKIADADPNTGLLQFLTGRTPILEEDKAKISEELDRVRREESGNIKRIQELENALLENEAALLENTLAIKDLEESQKDLFGFSSTSWELFRAAVLDGTGGLMPNIAAAVPHLASGGLITREGLAYVHAGENVVAGGGSSQQNYFNFTQPMEVADPASIAASVAWKLKHEKAH